MALAVPQMQKIKINLTALYCEYRAVYLLIFFITSHTAVNTTAKAIRYNMFSVILNIHPLSLGC